MTKSELITKYAKKISKLQKENRLRYSYDHVDSPELMEEIKKFSTFIKELKNLNGETVKLREVCPACEGKKVIIFNNVISECEFCKP